MGMMTGGRRASIMIRPLRESEPPRRMEAKGSRDAHAPLEAYELAHLGAVQVAGVWIDFALAE